MDYRIGHGYDVHRLADDLVLKLGGVTIPHSKGCVAHSDGDTAIHALCDAMLGALALGDIGKHFPDNSEQFKDIDSKILLDRTNCLITDRGYEVVNADITIVLERPKIAPYIDEMRRALSSTLKIDSDRISVKATTSEKMGFVGREEGVEAHAVVLLKRAR